MKYVLLGTVLFLLYGSSLPGPISLLRNTFDKFVKNKFIKGYLDRFYPPFYGSRNHTVVERIKEMQKFFHLAVTGKIDPTTIVLMLLPRCGMPDVTETQPTSPTWKKKVLTYRISNHTRDLSESKVNQSIEMAWKVWSDVISLTFKKVDEPADIEISFASGAHGDGNPFDGKGGTLAHAYFPGSGIGGDAHFDESEQWSVINREVNLFLVAAHEFGHSLGLKHSNVKGALMFPTYSYSNPNNFSLPDDDKERIQRLYGKKE